MPTDRATTRRFPLLRSRPRRVAAVSALCTMATLTAPHGAAAAPSASLDLSCYTPGMTQAITGSGFTPSGPVRLTLVVLGTGEEFTFETTADATGALAVQMRTPNFDAGRSNAALVTEDVTLQSQGAAPAQFAHVLGLTVSQWGIDVARWGPSGPARAKPGRRTAVFAYGWVGTATSTLYAHYLKGSRLAKTVTVGRLTGACGDLSTRMREFPFKARAGSYKVQFDTTRAYPNGDESIRYPKVIVGRRQRSSAALFTDVEPFRATAPATGGVRHYWLAPASALARRLAREG